MNVLQFTYRAFGRIAGTIRSQYHTLKTKVVFYLLGVKHGSFTSRGVPLMSISTKMGGISIGDGFAMNNGWRGNPIGQFERCTFAVSPGASIRIGRNVGISQTALVAADDITIGDNVKIGGGTAVYTTDFHSLDAAVRRGPDDQKERKTAPVIIGDDVFIGARCIILKGVTIGARSIVGAGSVVTKSIPEDEIWAGNPARCIRVMKSEKVKG